MKATGPWVEATLNHIDDHAWYLVQTNGAEWKDFDLFIMKGIQVAFKLAPEIVRGRPVRIAKINLQKDTAR